MADLTSIINQHKYEKELFLSRDYVPRTGLENFKKMINSDLVKVITGPRRSGKSVFAFLSLKNVNFGYVNFDDDQLINLKSDELLKSIFEVYGEVKILFFDEIQNYPNWELFINKLHRRGYNIILTGSNSNLLGRELSTSLTGRYLNYQILPFNFMEILKAKNFDYNNLNIEIPEIKGKVLNLLSDYLRFGGYPEIITKDIEYKDYLETLVEAILFKDIVKRYNIRSPQSLYNLFLNILNSYGKEISFQSLMRSSNMNSVRSVQKYVSYLEESYLIKLLNRFSFKVKEQIKAPKKVYAFDNGIISSKSFRFIENYGRALENLVFIELVKSGLKPNENIYYYKSKNQREIDFVIKDGLKVIKLIQVVYDISNEDVFNREIKSLLDGAKEINCNELIVITWDEESKEKINGQEINIIPLWKFLFNLYKGVS